MKLLIGNKNYSSWSLRPWLVLRHFDIAFEEELLLLNGEGWRERLRQRSPTGRVPVLIDGDLVVPETLAIVEYLADRFPDRQIWPAAIGERANARAVAAEMHAGFTDLRNHAPMNLRAHMPGRVDVAAVRRDLDRLEVSLGGLLQRSGGPFLFGGFSAADAMYAPVAARLKTYGLPVSAELGAYRDAVHNLPAFQVWLQAALKEPWIVPEDELDEHPALEAN